jgi:hypothetical protein
MIYHRLLSALLSQETPFPFEAFWPLVDVDPQKSLSEKFLSEVQDLLVDRFSFSCLNDITRRWQESVPSLKFTGVEPMLQLVYRRRRVGKQDKKASTSEVICSAEKLDIVQAIEQSLKDLGLPIPNRDAEDVIGTKEFDIDDEFLDKYLTDVFRWWNGQRLPRGVPVSLTNRCRSVDICFCACFSINSPTKGRVSIVRTVSGVKNKLLHLESSNIRHDVSLRCQF